MNTRTIERIARRHMEFYRDTYAKSPLWQGLEPLAGKHVIVYCEQGFGDVIQFARYIPKIRALGCRVTLHCPPELIRLFSASGLADSFISKNDDDLPPHDYHLLSMDLPFLVRSLDMDAKPYLSAHPWPLDGDDFKIGIAWEGNPNHSNNDTRSCPLWFFKHLSGIPDARLFVLQKSIHDETLTEGCEDMALYGWSQVRDFYDTARLVAAMDVVVTVDTSIVHLAGAMGKLTYCLLSRNHDPRWDVSTWYQSVKAAKQASRGDWETAFAKVLLGMGKKTMYRGTHNTAAKTSILLTGGIGDVFALESFFGEYERKCLHTVYYAARNHRAIREMFEAAGAAFPNLKNHVILWDDFSEFFAFYEKSDVAGAVQTRRHRDQSATTLPGEWPRVSDWSILPKFDQINAGHYEYTGSSLINHTVADISHLDLPDKFVVLVPWSRNDPSMSNREFTEDEWASVLKFIKGRGLKAVILNVGDKCDIEDDCLLDLTNQTTIPQSIEVMKRAVGYIGVDSCLSVMAAKLFDDILVVKSSNPHLFRWKHVYYAPKTDFSFITNEITSCAFLEGA